MAVVARMLGLAGAIFVVAVGCAQADTIVDSEITTDTTWTAANSPYVVIGSQSVRSGKTLTIEPGTVVQGDPVDWDTDPIGPSWPDLDGNVVIAGTDAAPVRVQALVLRARGGAIDHLIFEPRGSGMAPRLTVGDGTHISNSWFRDTEVDSYGSNVTVSDSRFTGSALLKVQAPWN